MWRFIKLFVRNLLILIGILAAFAVLVLVGVFLAAVLSLKTLGIVSVVALALLIIFVVSWEEFKGGRNE